MESHFYCVISYNKGIIHVTCSRTMHNLLLNIDFINYYCQQTLEPIIEEGLQGTVENSTRVFT
jgi:hypothetical protein